MRFSKTELKLLEQVALGKSRVPDLSAALKRDKSQTYRVIRSLRQKGFLGLKSGKADASRALHVQLLLGQLSRQPSFVGDLSGCGLKLCLFILDSPKSMREITKATGISADTVFCKLRAARGKSLIKTEGGRYRFNGELWKGLKEFLAELKRYEESYDSRIPPGSSIYRRAGEEIVFSTKAECDACADRLFCLRALRNKGLSCRQQLLPAPKGSSQKKRYSCIRYTGARKTEASRT